MFLYPYNIGKNLNAMAMLFSVATAFLIVGLSYTISFAHILYLTGNRFDLFVACVALLIFPIILAFLTLHFEFLFHPDVFLGPKTI